MDGEWWISTVYFFGGKGVESLAPHANSSFTKFPVMHLKPHQQQTANNKSYKASVDQYQWKFVLGFFLCLCLLLSSGRLASLDAGTQMQASLLLARTGKLGTLTPPKNLTNWIQSPNRDYYQVHDIGGILVMLPASLIGSITSKAPIQDLMEFPPIVTRLGISLTYACVGAVGCTFMYLTLASTYSTRSAFYLSLLLPFATMYGAYIKSAWDVLGAASAMCAVLYFSSRLLLGDRPQKNSLLAILSLLVAVSFRYSFAPFLLVGVVGVFYLAKRYLTWKIYLSCLSLLFVGMLPAFLYNYVRMGSPFRPATTAPIYLNGNNALGGNLLQGLLGLVFSPNRGILIFCPIFLLIFLLPAVWKKIPVLNRRLILCYSISACLYLLLIASMKNWGAFGWGPRYLMPIETILFFITVNVLYHLWNKYARRMIILICLSCAVSVPPILVNWDLVSTTFPNAVSVTVSTPQQIIGTWHGLILGLQGQLLPASPDVLNDPIRRGSAKFPDIWLVRLAEQSYIGLIASIIISIAILISMVFFFFRIITAPAIL